MQERSRSYPGVRGQLQALQPTRYTGKRGLSSACSGKYRCIPERGHPYPRKRWGFAVPPKNGTPQGVTCKAGGASSPQLKLGASALAPGDLALERKAAIAQEFGKWELSKYGWKSQAIMTPGMLRILAS